ncbi:MAG: sugar nucleotide-binding protein [Sulfuricurvum sp.]|uniref:sugar nucleotide-binding protein n=1 Tax=Sulfuricurvum sp. TaxID=2025608 RepID=UPI002610F55C|nr:sugar nucleotide-binding protein [Sulfuricurvum sp.]MDD2828446.1 sugar nucleotide-binding protein [Sulfuricurvum sp.]MDD4949451.1 sugar nucleotide-binding protein [Sulfuricurvum sp.]
MDMIIGNGQLAQAFINTPHDDIVFFASGVPNSNCTDESQFDRERQLLLSTLQSHNDKKFIYFSSCALSSKEYPKNRYYQHKAEMEQLIKNYSKSYYIFRIPQLFGHLKHHKTLINFLYESIINDQEFHLYNEAYRYVIEIEDVKNLVEAYLKYSHSSITIDLANDYRYKVLDIVKIFENLLNKKATYDIIDRSDGYMLDLTDMSQFIKTNDLNIIFSPYYLYDKLYEKLKNTPHLL